MRKALIVVDVQNDFCEGGALAVQGGNAVAKKIADYIDTTTYHAVVATADYHIDPGTHWSNTPDFIDSWPKHCEAGTSGVQINDELKDANIAAFFLKGKYTAAYSGFEGYSNEFYYTLVEWLEAAHVTHVDVVGLALDYCVKATALDAAERGYVTRILLDKTAAVHSDPASILRTVRELERVGVNCE